MAFVRKRNSKNLKNQKNREKELDSSPLADIAADLKKISQKSDAEITEVIELVSELKKNILIPAHIFSGKTSPLEALVIFLKEKHNLSITKIALILERSPKTIWTTYNNALKKKNQEQKITKSEVLIPLPVLTYRKLSILENIVDFLSRARKLSNSQIAALLNKSQKTVWTVKQRITRKSKTFLNVSNTRDINEKEADKK